MAKVKVIFPPAMLDATNGKREMPVTASAVSEALQKVTVKYEEAFKVWASPFARIPNLLAFFLNGKQITNLDELETELKDGDEIRIIVAPTGG